MAQYKHFAKLYQLGWYDNYSRVIADFFPQLLSYLGVIPKTILDIACGTGTFAIEMAKQGMQVTGVDISTQMLSIAKQKAREEKEKVEWLHQDMINLTLSKKFDMCTSWFDSLNYVLLWEDLLTVFQNVSQALTDKGYFIFDMNTRYGLIKSWNRYPSYVSQDNAKCFEVHQPSYDFETNIASMKITGFIKEGDSWNKIQEIHKEKGYSLQEIRAAFAGAGFCELHSFSNLQEYAPVEEQTGRVFFILKKGNIPEKI